MESQVRKPFKILCLAQKFHTLDINFVLRDRMDEVEAAWNERNPEAAFVTPKQSQDTLSEDIQVYSQDTDVCDQISSQSVYSQEGSETKFVQERASFDTSHSTMKESSIPMSKITESNTVPVVIKAGAYSKSLLLCECSDRELSFDGDAGAVGRMTVDDSSVIFDLKGRQYKGKLKKGPSVLILNMAPPVGQRDAEVTARAECVLNEYCSLTFEKDLLSDLKGQYTGEYHLVDDDVILNENKESVKVKFSLYNISPFL